MLRRTFFSAQRKAGRVSPAPFLVPSLVAFLLGSVSFSAAAATPDRYGEVLETAGDTDQIHGIRAGGFLALPMLGFKTTYHDNVHNAHDNKESDLVSTATGGLALKSNWNRHMVISGVSAQRTTYKEKSSEDYGTQRAFLSGRYDFAEETFLRSSASYSKEHRSRGAGDDVDQTDSVDYIVKSVGLGFSRGVGMIKFAAGLTQSVAEIDSASTALPTDYKTKDGKEGTAGITYERSPGNALYLRVNYTRNEYDLINGTTRDTDMVDWRTGLNFNTGGLYRGGLYASWQRRADSTVSDPEKLFALGGYLTWDITRLTSLTYSYDKAFSEGQVSGDDTALVSTQKLMLSNSFTRSVNSDFSVQADAYDYKNSGATPSATVYTGKVETRYSMTDSLDFGVDLTHRRRESDRPSQDYDANSVMFSVTYVH